MYLSAAALVVLQQMRRSWNLWWLIGCRRFGSGVMRWMLALREKQAKKTQASEREKRSGRVCVLALVWRASKAAIMQRQKLGCWRDTRSQRTKMCVLLTPATGASLAACAFSHQPLPWKHATPVSRPAKRIMARSRGGKERQTGIKTQSDSICSYTSRKTLSTKCASLTLIMHSKSVDYFHIPGPFGPKQLLFSKIVNVIFFS